MSLSSPRYKASQKDRTLLHPSLPQDEHMKLSMPCHTFVVTADTQFGMTNVNRSWQEEEQYSQTAIHMINELNPPPLFCCICGDLVDMNARHYAGSSKHDKYNPEATWTTEECDQVQEEQNRDFRKTWDNLRSDIPLVCLCGNHDVGSRPTAASVHRFTQNFGDDYLAFWANGTYNIVVNSSVFFDPTEVEDIYASQYTFLEGRLKYAKENNARNIFIFGHHPWFLYKEDEELEDLTCYSVIAEEALNGPLNFKWSDKNVSIPIKHRRRALALFQKYNVSASFAGHFHQSMVSKASFGMDMITTGPLSMLLKSTGVPKDFDEPRTRGIRIVTVQAATDGGCGNLSHCFVSLGDLP